MDEEEVLELGLRGGDGALVERSVTHSWIINERVGFTDVNNSIREEESKATITCPTAHYAAVRGDF